MKIRILIGSMLIAGLISVSTALASSPTNCGIFRDVSATHINCAAIQYAYQQGIFSGYNVDKYNDSTADFKPDQAIIRAEVLKVALAAFVNKNFTNTGVQGDAFPYSDLKGWGNQWWFAYLQEAMNRKMIEGYKDGTFKPQNNVTRAEFLKIFLSASPSLTQVTTEVIHNYDNLWADTAPTAWYAQYMIFANINGLFADFNYCEHGSICPNKDISRANVAQMIYNYHVYLKVPVGFAKK